MSFPDGAGDVPEAPIGSNPCRRAGGEVSAYVHPHVLVIDEVGYLQCATDAANALYGVVDQRCLKRRPIVFTTNKPLKRWGEVLRDHELAEALLDRVLESGEHIRLAGAPFRTRSVDPKALETGEA